MLMISETSVELGDEVGATFTHDCFLYSNVLAGEFSLDIPFLHAFEGALSYSRFYFPMFELPQKDLSETALAQDVVCIEVLPHHFLMHLSMLIVLPTGLF